MRVAGARLRVITGQLVPAEVPPDPLAFQAECVRAFVASWTVRGFAATTIGNDAALLERMLAALGRPAWEVTAGDVDRVVGELAAAGRAVSTPRNYLQVFKGFHRFLEARKAAEIEAGSASGWPARSMSSTPLAMSVTTRLSRTRRRPRSG